MTVKEFLKQYDEGKKFSDRELNEIFNLDLEEDEDDVIYVVEEEYDEPRRWNRNHTIWASINDRYFELNADEGLTELQDTTYWQQPKEVSLKVVTRTVVVTENEWSYVK